MSTRRHCVVWTLTIALGVILAGCTASPPAYTLHDCPGVPGLEHYEGQQEVCLDSALNAVRVALAPDDLEVDFYWDPHATNWERLVADYSARLETEIWHRSQGDEVEGIAVWRSSGRGPQQVLVLASIPADDGARIVVVLLATP